MLTLNSSTIFVADMVIRFGRYGLFVWPMWLWPIWSVADMVQTQWRRPVPHSIKSRHIVVVKCRHVCRKEQFFERLTAYDVFTSDDKLVQAHIRRLSAQ